MKSKEFLKRIAKMDSLINNKLVELEQWKALAMGVTVATEGERVQSSGNKQRMADAINRYIDLEEEINQRIDEFIDVKKQVVRIIEQLPAAEYDVLHRRYVQYKEYYEIADDMRKSKSWVTSVHGRALTNVQKIIDERKNNVTSETSAD